MLCGFYIIGFEKHVTQTYREVSLNPMVSGTINNPSVGNMKFELEGNIPGIYNNVRVRQWVGMSMCMRGNKGWESKLCLLLNPVADSQFSAR